MASKNINIESELYEKLKKMKKNKSFTQFTADLLEFSLSAPKNAFGLLSEVDISYQEIKENRIEKNVTL